jgi:ERCC4-type nuclease
MLLLDDREKGFEAALRGNRLVPEVTRLDCADFAFILPHVTVGVERKSIGDLLRVIADNRFVSEQLPCLATTYNRVYLLVEGRYKKDPESGLLLIPAGNRWKPVLWGRRNGWTYAEVERWLTSREENGIRLRRTNGPTETAQQLTEMYTEFAKPPEARRSAVGVYTPQITNPDGSPLLHAPSETRRVARLMPGIGDERSAAVADAFASPFDLVYSAAMAKADVGGVEAKNFQARWLAIAGIGEETVKKVGKWAVSK